MTSTGQNFTTYSGNDVQPRYTVRNAAGTAIDISTVQEIAWQAQRDLESDAVISKLKTDGQISFVTDGTDGKFYVNITSADTDGLSGFYMVQAIITDFGGWVSTVSLGRMQVGRAPVWTYSGDPSVSDRDAVRFLIGDTDGDNPKVYDAEIDYQLTVYINPTLAAAVCARALAGKYSSKVSKRVGDLSIDYGALSKQYRDLADELEARGNTFNLQPYSGGTSKSDKATVCADTDRVKPPFRVKQFDDRSSPFGSTGSGGGE